MKVLESFRKFLRALALGTPSFREHEPTKHVTTEAEHKVGKGLVKDGTLSDPQEARRIAPHHRVIVGMGSGGPEDVNTYAMFDALSEEQRAAVQARSRLPTMKYRRVLSGDKAAAAIVKDDLNLGETRNAGNMMDGVVGAFDQHYERDENGDLKLKGQDKCQKDDPTTTS